MSRTKKTMIPLDIALDYPVEWKFERILRDLIQNFYDSIGWQNFGKEFDYSWEDEIFGKGTITMKTVGHPFSYEWLTCIGGSTKTNSPGNYIGMYGEGFKMCMLCLERDSRCYITMESQEWRISPCRYRKRIDGKIITMLGYRLEAREDDGCTKLVIRHVDERHRSDVYEALLNFFYPDNPLFGSMIAEGEDFAIYERSAMEIPFGGPYPSRPKGILYCNYLARGRLPFPFIILEKKDMRRRDSRKRELLTDNQTKVVVTNVMRKLSPVVSVKLLLMMESVWSELPPVGKELSSWYYAVCQLVRNISTDDEVCRNMNMESRNLVYLERKTTDRKKNKLIDEAARWSAGVQHGRKVNPIFRLLGARSLVEEYKRQRMEGFDEPDEWEKRCAELLFLAAEDILPWALYEQRPTLIIQKNHTKDLEPTIFSVGNHSSKGSGRRRKYQLEYVVMKYQDFETGNFKAAFLKFSDILLHAYGTSKSEKVNCLLTSLGAVYLKNREKITYYEGLWDAGTRGKLAG